MRKFSLATLAVCGSLVAIDAEAVIFNNDTFRISQEESDSFGLFLNGSRLSTLTGTGDLTATFTERELINLLLPNNGVSTVSLRASNFFEFVARDLRGLVDVNLAGDNVEITFKRRLVTDNLSGTSSFKYTRPNPNGQTSSDRNFVQIIGESLPQDVVIPSPDDSDPLAGGIPTVELVDPSELPVAGAGDSSNAGPFRNDTLEITKVGDEFQLSISGIQLTSIADTGGDIAFSIDADTLLNLLLVNNGVSAVSLESASFTDFVGRDNFGLVNVSIDGPIEFIIDRDFVLNELEGESSLKYVANGRNAREFLNFVGRVEDASPSS